jgi:hypothetical protein
MSVPLFGAPAFRATVTHTPAQLTVSRKNFGIGHVIPVDNVTSAWVKIGGYTLCQLCVEIESMPTPPAFDLRIIGSGRDTTSPVPGGGVRASALLGSMADVNPAILVSGSPTATIASFTMAWGLGLANNLESWGGDSEYWRFASFPEIRFEFWTSTPGLTAKLTATFYGTP